MFAIDNQHIALMVNMTCLFKRIYNLIFILVFIDNFKKLVNKTNESNINNDIAILGSSFVGALAYTFSDSFGSMRRG
jgi:hypothetical protein